MHSEIWANLRYGHPLKPRCPDKRGSTVPGTRYGLSDTGWINADLFKGWIVEHFIQYAVPGLPLLLLLDGHSTHYQPDVIRFARAHNIIMLCLPPHTTHESQPLDCGVFKPLKSKWTAVCHT